MHTCVYVCCVHACVCLCACARVCLYCGYMQVWPPCKNAKISFLLPGLRLTSRVGQNHIYIYTVYIQYFWQGNITKYTVIYGVYIRFWPTLLTSKDRTCTSVCQIPMLMLYALPCVLVRGPCMCRWSALSVIGSTQTTQWSRRPPIV